MSYETQEIHEYINFCRNELKTKISYPVMGIVMTLIIAIFGWLISNQLKQSDEISRNKDRVAEVSGDMKAVNVGIMELKASVLRIENKLDKNGK